MSENKNTRIWQWMVLLLVLCNIGLIATMWLKLRHQGPPHDGGGGGPRDFVVQQLKFTDDQVKKYDVLIQAHQDAMKKLRHDNSLLREKLFAGLKNDSLNSRFADSLASLIGANQKEIEVVTYNHFAQVRTLCTDDQKKTFDNIIGDVIKKMNGGPGGPRPPRGDGQGPPPPHEGDGPPPPPPPGDR